MQVHDSRPPFAGLANLTEEALATLPTPCYLLDEAQLRRNGESLLGVQQRTGCKILLAQKAFSNFDLYPVLAPYLAGTEASGLYESRLGREELPEKENHVFCAAYRADEFPELLQYADHIVFNSPSQLAKFGPAAKAAGKSVGLRRIKLLRKLDVPLAEIREMLEGRKTLSEGMGQQLERLNARRKDLDEAIGFCTVLEKASGNLEELDVEQTLARLAAREEQGVTFVNIERTDRKGERIRGACIGAALFVALMAFVIATMAWAFYSDPQEAPPLPLLIVLFGIPVGCIVGTLKVLLERIEEIGKGEEDAYRNY